MAEERDRGAGRPRLALSLLGGVRIALDGAPLTGFVTLKSQALLCYLAVTGRPHSREMLAALLWGDTPEEDAKASLRQVLWNLQKVVGPHVSITRQTVAFDRSVPHWLDVDAFSSATRAGSARAIGAYRRLAEAVDLYAGDFLAGFYVRDAPEFDEWAAAKREHLRQHALGALEQLAEHQARRGAYSTASEYLGRLLQLDPWREDAHRQRMLLLHYAGRRDAALSQYASLRRVLQSELGEEPAEETTTLYRRIRTGAVERPVPPPARHNLPAPPTPLLGRQAELGQITGLLADPACRLLTLVGPGGIGKTRLALQVAQEHLDDFADGVFFVSLAPISHPSLVVQAVARTLDVGGDPGRPPVERLKDWLRPKQLLLVLDNFEHVLLAAALVADLISACPDLKLLVTSRSVLRLRAEHEFAVPALPLPDPRRPEPLNDLRQYPSVGLFVERARSARPGFALTAENAEAIAEICRRLDGLPLAIELAAARVRLLSPGEILQRLGSRLSLLSAGAEDLPPRQRTLRDTIGWSYNLLSEPERELFRRLAVFAGGWTLEGVEAVCAGTVASERAGDTEVDVLAALTSLADKSLVLRQEQPNGGLRFGMLETIREYALEQLKSGGDEEKVRDRHASYYLGLAEAAKPHLTGPRQKVWLDRLEEEHDNLRGALAWWLDRREPEQALRLAVALSRFWLVHGYLTEGCRWLEAALAAGGAIEPGLRARGLNNLGSLTYQRADYERAAALHTEALELRRRLEDKWGMAVSLGNLGLVAQEQHDYAQAELLYQEVLVLFQELEDEWSTSLTIGNLGTIAYQRQSYARAQEMLEEATARFRRLGDQRFTAAMLGGLGKVVLAEGDDERAEQVYAEGLAIARGLDDRENIAVCLAGLAVVAAERGDSDRATRLWGAAEALREAIGMPLPPSERPGQERAVASARARVDEAQWEIAWAEGRALTPEAAMAEALGEA